MVQGEVPFPEVARAALLARDADASVFWNPAPVAEGDIRPCFEMAGTVVVNTSEAATIAGRLGIPGDPESFAERLATPVRSVIVTLGADGVVARTHEARYRFRSPQVEAVDSTGAGDAFCGAVAAALDRQVAFERRAQGRRCRGRARLYRGPVRSPARRTGRTLRDWPDQIT